MGINYLNFILFFRPQEKVCNGQGAEECRTVYESSCTTKYYFDILSAMNTCTFCYIRGYASRSLWIQLREGEWLKFTQQLLILVFKQKSKKMGGEGFLGVFSFGRLDVPSHKEGLNLPWTYMKLLFKRELGRFSGKGDLEKFTDKYLVNFYKDSRHKLWKFCVNNFISVQLFNNFFNFLSSFLKYFLNIYLN